MFERVLNEALAIVSVASIIIIEIYALRMMNSKISKYDKVIEGIGPAIHDFLEAFSFLKDIKDDLPAIHDFLEAFSFLKDIKDDLPAFFSTIKSLFTFQVDENGGVLVPEPWIALGQSVGQSAAQSIKMSLLGEKSGDARLNKGLEGAVALDIANNQIPFLGALDDLLGDAVNLKQFIKKNPRAALQLAKEFAPSMLQGSRSGVRSFKNSYGR